MPELMETIFGSRENSFSVGLLKKFEKWSIGFADVVITCNRAFKRPFSSRSCSPEKITVIMNSPDERIFWREPWQLDPGVRDGSKSFVIMYHGALEKRHGLDLAVKAMRKVRETI